MGKKIFIIVLLFFLFNIELFSFIYIVGKENEIINGKIILREQKINTSDIVYEKNYYVIFDDPWKVKIFETEITFNEILIANDIEIYFNGIDYENKILKIHCSLVIETIDEQIFFAIVVNNVTVVN